jgi:hypothetical protein
VNLSSHPAGRTVCDLADPVEESGGQGSVREPTVRVDKVRTERLDCSLAGSLEGICGGPLAVQIDGFLIEIMSVHVDDG